MTSAMHRTGSRTRAWKSLCDFWRDVVCRSYVEMETRPLDRVDRFSGSIAAMTAGAVQVSPVRLGNLPHLSARTPGTISRANERYFVVGLVLDGYANTTGQASLGRQALAFWASSPMRASSALEPFRGTERLGSQLQPGSRGSGGSARPARGCFPAARPDQRRMRSRVNARTAKRRNRTRVRYGLPVSGRALRTLAVAASLWRRPSIDLNVGR